MAFVLEAIFYVLGYVGNLVLSRAMVSNASLFEYKDVPLLQVLYEATVYESFHEFAYTTG